VLCHCGLGDRKGIQSITKPLISTGFLVTMQGICHGPVSDHLSQASTVPN